MSRKFFGTDGVRGRANSYPMTADFCLKLGAAAGSYFRRANKKSHRVVIGKDTRLSGYMFENALTAGLTSSGMNVLLLGPVPTPAVGLLTNSMRADLGIMISASHNEHSDNGIKFFGPDGYKLSDSVELEIEALVSKGIVYVSPEDIGRAKRIDDGRYRYIERVKSSFPNQMRLDGLKVVIDCANGAGYKAAPEVLWELGAEVIPVGVSPDGRNINLECGSTSPTVAAETVVAHGADVAICLDGDADRVLIIDEYGRPIDGDQFLGMIGSRWFKNGNLVENTLVSTVMSNMRLEAFLKQEGIKLVRTFVGDRYVVERMRLNGFNLGGEKSGHVVMMDYSTTGDGLMAGLQFLAEMVRTGEVASVVGRPFDLAPQKTENITYAGDKNPLDHPSIKKIISESEKKISGFGRLLVRKSGTEKLIRIMVEAEDASVIDATMSPVVAAIKEL
ncbi:MAG: phosphoglucosamine mutase [Paracoccaceae bacterium]|uniref:phosphoglucosamine mutase n=1 Tax=Candidatus Salinivivens marinus TaxID=3381703 RepID=UPI000B678C02|nr:phosphoglucosamine mutase [Marinovum sp.]OUU13195.1 MAG: phosphoglucosamine mutase [Rhodobacteraceae bacterium TMED38]PDH58459.1 MAG: phosphoglucosamine mutase [Rhodobacteraceae bacterium MED-G08]|tara:strand:- start:13623 stop:14963 length:1341 start_codon:yes stop_codon:yes gene_type:complete